MFDLRDLTVPVVAAPMAGGGSTAALAAAVSAVGGLGVLAAGYKAADQVAAEIEATRRATSGPIGVNLFVVAPYDPPTGTIEAYRRTLEPEAARLGVALGEPAWDDDDWTAKLEVVLTLRPEVVSFTFGCPDADILRSLAQRGIHTAATVTTVLEARQAAGLGVHSLCVQGPEAGGHRGTWDLEAEPEDGVGLTDLVSAILPEVDLPVVAAGAISEPAAVEGLLRRGAAAVQVGTALLLADEAGTHPAHRAALADPAFTHTERTRAFTGRWARGLANRFVRDHADAPPGYPQIHHLTAPLRAAALAAGDTQTAHLWAGTGFRSVRSGPAQQIIETLAP